MYLVFYVDDQKAPKILRAMSEIKFTHLSQLNLYGNGIESIEVLSRSHLQLQQLLICKNEST